MKRALATIAVLASLFGAAPAAALDIYANGEHTRVVCSGSGSNTSCFVTRGPAPNNSAKAMTVPPYDRSDISDTWGDGCRSCVDLSRSGVTSIEAGK